MMTNAGGNCTGDGRGGYNCTNVDPARYKQQAANCGNQQSAATFTYFYINGINTPRSNADWRGSCQSEHDTVGINLVGDSSVSNSRIPQAQGTSSIKVGSETDVMYGLTCNPSGQDPLFGDWIAQNCSSKPGGLIGVACDQLKSINNFRAGGGAGLTPGDVWECARQAISFPALVPQPRGFDIQNTALDQTVQQVVNVILSAYQKEQSGGNQSKNYFIVVAHSQGNFFAEGVGYNLLNFQGQTGRDIFAKRLGMVSLGSPTSYGTLRLGDPTRAFVSSKIVHHTRADDAINIVTTINQILGGYGVTGKQPWPINDPPLWPWPPSQPAQSLFTRDQLAFPCNGLRGYIAGQNCDPFSATFWRRLQYNAGSGVSNPELYTPMMNSHLLDNYLDTPTATRPGIYLPLEPQLLPFAVSPKTTSVLNCIRRDLQQLKTNLLNGTSTPVATQCSAQ